MKLLAPSLRRLRVAAAWLALAAAGQGVLGGLAHLHEHEAGHEEAAHGHLVTLTGEAEGCAQRHLHAVHETREEHCSACALAHGKGFRAQPAVLATVLAVPGPVVPGAAPVADRRALAPLPARGPPIA